MRVPPLETARLLIRPFAPDDLDAALRLFDRDRDAATVARRARWLQWAALNDAALADLGQPPYGDRAIVLKATGDPIGAVGYVPCLDAFGQLPSLQDEGAAAGLTAPEFGLFWTIAPDHRRRGYATEAARAMIDRAFAQLRLRRIIATTGYDNAPSIGVMRKLGMRIERNPFPEPPSLQVVGILDNPAR